jgi:hypothetical protein
MVFVSILILFASIATIGQGYSNLDELVVNILYSRGATTNRPIIIPLFLQSFWRPIKLPLWVQRVIWVQFFGDVVLLYSSKDEHASSYIFRALLFFVIMIWVEKLRLCFIGASSCTLHTSIISTNSYLSRNRRLTDPRTRKAF